MHTPLSVIVKVVSHSCLVSRTSIPPKLYVVLLGRILPRLNEVEVRGILLVEESCEGCSIWKGGGGRGGIVGKKVGVGGFIQVKQLGRGAKICESGGHTKMTCDFLAIEQITIGQTIMCSVVLESSSKLWENA